MAASKYHFDKDHRVGRLDVVASVHDFDNAMSYRPQLEALAWERFPEVLERVFDKHAPADTVFQLDELDLDLGTIRPAFLETDTIFALEQALEEALVSAAHNAKHSPQEDSHLLDITTWRLQRIETFLRSGAPGYSNQYTEFDPQAEIIWFLANEPAAFVAMLRDQWQHPYALDRLILQTNKVRKKHLVTLLAPSQAEETITLIHDIDKLLATSMPSLPSFVYQPDLKQKIWVRLIRYLSSDSTAQYRPAELLTEILDDVARHINISLPELIASLSAAYPKSENPTFLNPTLQRDLMKLETKFGKIANAAVEKKKEELKVGDIKQWRALIEQATGSKKAEVFEALTKREFEELLLTWGGADLLAGRNDLARAFASVTATGTVTENQINFLIFDFISSHINTSANYDLLWQHVLAALRPTNDDKLAAEILSILLSNGSEPATEIGTLVKQHLGQKIAVSDPPPSSSGQENKAQAAGQNSDQLQTGEPGTSNTVLINEIAEAVTGGVKNWILLLREYAQTDAGRARLLRLITLEQFRSLLTALNNDPKIDAMHQALISTASKVLSSNSASVINLGILEYIAGRLNGPVNHNRLWQHVFKALVSTEGETKKGSEIIRLLSEGTDMERALAEILSAKFDAKKDPDNSRPESQRSNQQGEKRKAVYSDERSGDMTGKYEIESADSANSIPWDTDEWAALLQHDVQSSNGRPQWKFFLQHNIQSPSERDQLISRLTVRQFGAMLQIVTGDAEAEAAREALVLAAKHYFGESAENKVNAALLQFLSAHIRKPIILTELWEHVLRVLIPASLSTEDRLARSRKIFDLLPYNNKYVKPELYEKLSKIADEHLAAVSKSNDSGSKQNTEIDFADLILDSEKPDEQSLLDKLRTIFPKNDMLLTAPNIRLSESEFADVLRQLDPTAADDILIGLNQLLDVHAYKPIGTASEDRFAHLARYIVITVHLYHLPGKSDPVSFWELIIDHLAQTFHVGAGVMSLRLQFGLLAIPMKSRIVPALKVAIERLAKSDQLMEQKFRSAGLSDQTDVHTDSDPTGILHAKGSTGTRQKSSSPGFDFDNEFRSPTDPATDQSAASLELPVILSDSDRNVVKTYLRAGNHQQYLQILAEVAHRDPEWLADVARETATLLDDAVIVAERLLFWLLPIEIAAILDPELSVELVQKAAKSANEQQWWRDTIAALLLRNNPSIANISTKDIGPSKHFDLLKSLQLWVDGHVALEDATEEFLRLTRAEQTSILRARTVDDTLIRIQHVSSALDTKKTRQLLRGLMGWTLHKRGALASLIDENKVVETTILMRAAAASIVSTEIDLAGLPEPLPDIDQARQSQNPSNSDFKKHSNSRKIGKQYLISWLDGNATKPGMESHFSTLFNLLIDDGDPQLLDFVSMNFRRQEYRKRWVEKLPVNSLGRLLHYVEPGYARTLYDGIMLLTVAGSQVTSFSNPPINIKKIWETAFAAVVDSSRIDLPSILTDLITKVAGGNKDLHPKIRARALALAADGGHNIVATTLRRDPEPSSEQRDILSSQIISKNLSWDDFGTEKMSEMVDETPDGPIYIANAGLILVNPFLPAFFERLDVLSHDQNDKPYIDPGPPASRAVHFLQYLATEQTDTPEPHLVLNKIICGLPTGTPVATAIEVEDDDIKICDGLLHGILENWPSLQGTSVDGLRETFLQREGRLEYREGKWHLRIQRKTLDILKDQVPWNTSIVYHPWMKDPIHTTW